MPKGKSKSGGGGGGGGGKGTPRKGTPTLRNPRRGGGAMSDDESINGDAASIVSLNSDRGSYDENVVENDGLDHDDGGSGGAIHSRETLEEKIAESIDAMTEKSANTRANSLNTLTTILSQQFLPDLVLNRRETLRDNLEKIFKRGQRSEQGLAAGLASLAALQVGAFDPELATEDFGTLKPMLQSLLLDHTVPVPVRVKCCQALCLGAFLAESCLDDVSNLLAILEPLFGVKTKQTTTSGEEEDAIASPSKSATVKIPKNVCGSLASVAIGSWSLLVTLMPPEYLKPRCIKWTQTLLALLDVAELEVRLNAGEALAVLVEVCDLYQDSDEEEDYGSTDEDTTTEIHSNGVSNGKINGSNGVSTNGHSNYGGHHNKVNMRGLIAKLRQLSVESHKYRTKKDRRQQRHSFRDYLHAVEEGEGPGQSIKFGCGEVLDIDSWVKKRQYDAICQVLGSGINRHLLDNILVRQIMELGAPRPAINDGGYGAKQAKNERQYLNAVNFKARCVSRGKSRDQRAYANLSDF